jgi:hypothetical protein
MKTSFSGTGQITFEVVVDAARESDLLASSKRDTPEIVFILNSSYGQTILEGWNCFALLPESFAIPSDDLHVYFSFVRLSSFFQVSLYTLLLDEFTAHDQNGRIILILFSHPADIGGPSK